MKKILHIVYPEKFINDYIYFVNNNFNPHDHLFLYLKTKGNEPNFFNVKIIKFYRIPILFHLNLFIYFIKSEKIFLHSLFKSKIINFLFVFPFFAKKCYWLLWGGDMYYRIYPHKLSFKKNIKNYIFKNVVKHLGNILTYIEGDVAIARKVFGFNGKYYECLLYPSNIVNNNEFYKSQNDEVLIILIGNSAHKSNNHFEIFKKISYLKDKNVLIYCPLSYGDKKNAKLVIKEGKKLFGDKFVPLERFMPLNEYVELLKKIDVAIFNHWRQQAMGNIITLISMGKTVYVRSDISTWDMLNKKGFVIKDILKDAEIELINSEFAKSNHDLAKKIFSEENLLNQYKKIFYQ